MRAERCWIRRLPAAALVFLWALAASAIVGAQEQPATGPTAAQPAATGDAAATDAPAAAEEPPAPEPNYPVT